MTMQRFRDWAKLIAFTAFLTAAIEALQVLTEAFLDGVVSPMEWKHVAHVFFNSFIAAAFVKRPGDKKEA